MPVYQYQDKHYELPEGLSTEQALSKIKAHLGQTAAPAAAPDSDFMKSMKEFGGTALDALKMLPQFGMDVNPAMDRSEGLKGPVEAIAHAATSVPGFFAGLAASPIAKGFDPSQSIPEHASRISNNLTYDAKTDLGEDLSKPFDELMYRAQGLVGHGTPDLPQGSHSMPIPKGADTLPPMRNKTMTLETRKAGGLDINKFAAEQQGVDTAPAPSLSTRRKGAQGELFPDTSVTEKIGKKDNTVVPGAASQFDPFQEQSPYIARTSNSGQMDLPMGQGGRVDISRLGEGDNPRAEFLSRDEPHLPSVIRQDSNGVGTLGNENPGLAQAIPRSDALQQQLREQNAGPGAFNEMQQQLRAGEQSPVTPQGVSPVPSTAADLLARPAQQALDLRQAAMQQEVAQRQSLDFNAAERARQEAAPVPGLADDQARQAQEAQAQQQRAAQEQQAAAEQQRAAQQQSQAATEAGKPALYEAAQRAADERQRQMEFEVKRQQTADFNAAERARQENAPVPGMDNSHVSTFRDYQESMKAAESDPRVLAAADKVRQAEELFTRVADGMQSGLQQHSDAILNRLEGDIQHFEEAAKAAQVQVVLEEHNPLKNNPISSAGPRGRQRGAVDMSPLRDAVKSAIDHLTKLAGDLPPVRSMLQNFQSNPDPQVISVTRKVMKEEGADPKVLNALDKALVAAHKMQLGNVENQVNPLRKISPGGRQTGAILLEPNKREAVGKLADKLGIETHLGELSASQWTPERAVEEAKKGKDVDQNNVQKFFNNFTKGGVYQALKTHNPMIRYVVEKIQEADRLSRALIRDWVQGRLAPAMRELNGKEQAQIWHAIEIADMSQRPLDYEALARSGATEAQIRLAKELREGLDFGYDQINRARAAAGKEPIDKRTAYAAMRATGDFRRIVYDKAGNDAHTVGVISSNYRKRVNGLKEEMEKKGYTVGEERYFGSNMKDRNSSNEAFMSAIEHLADNDPRVADFVDVLHQLRESEVYSYLNTKKHTMDKKGVFGMDGRKSWMNEEENAVDGFKSQLAYMEATIKWGNLSEAAAAIKPVMTDPSVKMPVAKAWSEQYLKNALGFNPSAVGSHLDAALSEAFKHTGVGYSAYRKGVAVTRQVTNGLLLMLNPRFWTTNLVQPLQGMPGMKAMLIARGLDSRFDLGTGYSYLAQAANTIMKKNTGIGLEGFETAAAKYARDHHVYGSDMIEHSNSIKKDAGYYAEKTSNFAAGAIESITRQLAFYSFVHMLKENGMSEANGLHTAAHNLTDLMMNNYSAIDRPSVYHSLGPVGEVAVNLQSYKHNELSRISLFARHVQEYKSVRPIVAHMTAGLVYGGIMGSLAYDEVDQAYHTITKIMGKPDSLTNRVLSLSEGMGKMMYGATGGKVDQPYLLSHGIFSMAGADMTRSLGLTQIVPDNPADLVFPGVSKLGEIGKAAYNTTGLPGGDAGSGPTEMNAKRLGRSVAPPLVAGGLDNQWFTKPDGLAVRPRDLAGQAYKNSTDTALKYGGFSGVNEAVQRQKTFNIERQARDYSDMRTDVLSTLRDQIYTGDLKGKTIQKYIDARGSPKTLTTDMKKYAEQQNMSAEEFNTMHAAMSKGIAQRMKALEYVRMFDDANKH